MRAMKRTAHLLLDSMRGVLVFALWLWLWLARMQKSS